MTTSDHVHRLEPGDPGATPLLLLHGADGSEADLLPLAGRIAPGATRLAVRGAARSELGSTFFRRHADRSLDEVDLQNRLEALLAFLESCLADGLVDRPPVLVGYSNGAIMGAALLLDRPGLLAGAILLRPLSPWIDDRGAALDGAPVLIVDGKADDRRSPGDGLQLAQRLAGKGATVGHHVLPHGHALTPDDEQLCRIWLGSLPAPRP